MVVNELMLLKKQGKTVAEIKAMYAEDGGGDVS